MLKKYLNYYDAIRVFVLFALSLLMCFTVAATMFLSMPPEGIHSYILFRQGVTYMEYILASILITLISTMMLTYISKLKK